jgi:hypothetical protein
MAETARDQQMGIMERLQYVLGLHQDYDIRLCHYTEGWAETVMFFMPKRN